MAGKDTKQKLLELVDEVEEYNSHTGQIEPKFDDEHESLITLMNKLTQNMRDADELGEYCIAGLTAEMSNKLRKCFTDYLALMNIPASCCGLIKPNRSGDKYMKRFAILKGQVIEGIFLIRAGMISFQCAELKRQSIRINEFASIISQSSAAIAKINVKNSEVEKRNAKNELLNHYESLEKFANEFSSTGKDDEVSNFFREIKEMLATPLESQHSKKRFDQAKKYLHELLSLGANVVSTRAKQNSDKIMKFIKALEEARDDELKSFEEIENTYSIVKGDSQFLVVKECSGSIHTIVHNNLTEVGTMWNDIKSQVSSKSFLTSLFNFDEVFSSDSKTHFTADSNDGMKKTGSGGSGGVFSAATDMVSKAAKGTTQFASSVGGATFKAASIAADTTTKAASSTTKLLGGYKPVSNGKT